MARIQVPSVPAAIRMRNQYKPHFEGGIECLICDSPIKPGKGIYVHLLTTNELASKDESNISEAEDQGYHLVGSECAKKVPAPFRFKREDIEEKSNA